MATNNQGIIWKKRILIPFWVFRILCNIIIIIIAALAIKVIKDADASDGIDEQDKSPAIGVVAVFMLLIVACLLIDVLAILLFMRDALKPLTLLIMSVLQTTFWVVILILDIVAIARGAYGGGFIFSLAILASYAGILLYAAVQYHKHRKNIKRGQYSPTANPAGVPLGHTYGNYSAPHNTNTAYTSPAPYQPPPQNGAAASYYQTGPKTQV